MRKLHRTTSTLLAIGMTFCLSGCYAIIDDCIECENAMVNTYRAHKAWYEQDDCADEVEHRKDFKRGFLDGYQETAENGAISSYGHCQNERCLPLMPPRRYWKHCYQDCEGRQKIDAWYRGWAHGAMAAESDGVYASSIIPTYGLHSAVQQPGAYHSSVLEEDVHYDEHGRRVPEPEGTLPGSDELVPVPRTYDDVPKLPPADDATSLDEPVSAVSYESVQSVEQMSFPQWATQSPAAPAAEQADYADYRVTERPRSDHNIPNARFTTVKSDESTARRAQWETSASFVLPVGYEGFRAPEWSEGASRE